MFIQKTTSTFLNTTDNIKRCDEECKINSAVPLAVMGGALGVWTLVADG